MSANPEAPAEDFVLADIDQNTEVRITVTPKVSGEYNYVIEHYPKRRRETTIYHSATASLANPSKPREVLWYVEGLEAGQTILIREKYPNSDRFKQAEYRITHPNNAIMSGPAKHHPPAGQSDQWQYSIHLVDENNEASELAEFIDPTIVIEHDP